MSQASDEELLARQSALVADFGQLLFAAVLYLG
jgi:hypothetical protein